MTPEEKIVCPNCGTEIYSFSTPAISVEAIIFSSPDEDGVKPTDIQPKPISKMKASEKIAALEKAGVDVSKLFSVNLVGGGEKLTRLEGRNLVEIDDDDPIFSAIIGSGTVPNRRLFRRWVMGQMFRMMIGWRGNFTKELRAKGLSYQWKMMIEEFRVQAKLAERDMENFMMRSRWFNREVLVAAAEDYLVKCEEHIRNAAHRKCKGRPYVRLRHRRDVFVDDLKGEVFQPMLVEIKRMRAAMTPNSLYKLAKRFYDLIEKTWVNWEIPMSDKFIDAYKGAGAYFTMRNLILFHGCTFQKDWLDATGKANSIDLLEHYAEEYKHDGWRLFGIMRQLLDDNGIDIKAKLKEWRNAKIEKNKKQSKS